jgi:hypothetical protein
MDRSEHGKDSGVDERTDCEGSGFVDRSIHSMPWRRVVIGQNSVFHGPNQYGQVIRVSQRGR